jgi:hypothetical protein
MSERNWFELKYIDVFTHRVGSVGSPSRRRMFNGGANTEHRKISNIASGDTKTNNFQTERAGSGATINLNLEKCINIMSPFT